MQITKILNNNFLNYNYTNFGANNNSSNKRNEHQIDVFENNSTKGLPKTEKFAYGCLFFAIAVPVVKLFSILNPPCDNGTLNSCGCGCGNTGECHCGDGIYRIEDIPEDACKCTIENVLRRDEERRKLNLEYEGISDEENNQPENIINQNSSVK